MGAKGTPLAGPWANGALQAPKPMPGGPWGPRGGRALGCLEGLPRGAGTGWGPPLGPPGGPCQGPQGPPSPPPARGPPPAAPKQSRIPSRFPKPRVRRAAPSRAPPRRAAGRRAFTEVGAPSPWGPGSQPPPTHSPGQVQGAAASRARPFRSPPSHLWQASPATLRAGLGQRPAGAIGGAMEGAKGGTARGPVPIVPPPSTDAAVGGGAGGRVRRPRGTWCLCCLQSSWLHRLVTSPSAPGTCCVCGLVPLRRVPSQRDTN